jgi:hypothetical protein
MKKKIKKTLVLFIIIIVTFIFNFLIEQIVIPDPCYYHMNDGGFIFNLFYDLPAGNGGHPWPSNFNYIFTFFIGLTIGIIIQKKK